MKRRKPIEVTVPGKQGRVKIYHTKDGGTASGYAFQVADYSSGKRKLWTFADEGEARAKAKDIITKMQRGDHAAISLNNRDAAAYLQSKEMADALGIPLQICVLHFSKAVGIIGADEVIEAAKLYKARTKTVVAEKTVDQVFDELLADARKRKLSARYLEDLEYRCGKFAEAMPNTRITSVTQADIQAFFDAPAMAKLSPRSKNNFIGSISRMFEFAKARKYLPKDHDEMSGIDRVSESRGEVAIYTPEEISRLLNAATEDIRPIIALGAFAGIRSAELERLDWSHVKLATGYIILNSDVTKTKQRRVIPISENLKRWLTPLAKDSGPVWTKTPVFMYERFRDAAKATAKDGEESKVEWRQNALRHSFCSYRLAQTQDAAKTAVEAGNSPRMISRHYLELVTPEQAAAWFSV
jgi:integrase